MKGTKILNRAGISKQWPNFIGFLPVTETIAGQAVHTTFLVTEELGAGDILGCKYIDAVVHEINVKNKPCFSRVAGLFQYRGSMHEKLAPMHD